MNYLKRLGVLQYHTYIEELKELNLPTPLRTRGSDHYLTQPIKYLDELGVDGGVPRPTLRNIKLRKERGL